MAIDSSVFAVRGRISGRLRPSFRSFLAACILLFTLTGTVASAGRTAVTIRNDQFQVIKVLNSSRSLSNFRKIWNRKKKTPRPSFPLQWRYKIDFPDGSRWLYDARGFAMLATPKKVPLYRLPFPDRLNAIIGASKYQRTPEPDPLSPSE